MTMLVVACWYASRPTVKYMLEVKHILVLMYIYILIEYIYITYTVEFKIEGVGKKSTVINPNISVTVVHIFFISMSRFS